MKRRGTHNRIFGRLYHAGKSCHQTGKLLYPLKSISSAARLRTIGRTDFERSMFRGMSILKLKPSCKDYLWGGNRLFDKEHVAFLHRNSIEHFQQSILFNPLFKFLFRRFRDFPILTKFIDAKDNLSIQVHPDNRYALENEGQYGKTEMLLLSFTIGTRFVTASAFSICKSRFFPSFPTRP